MRKDLQLLKLITVLGLALFCSILAIAQPNEWTKYEDNPVLSSPLWGEGAFYPAVLHEEGVYKMWYSAFNGDYTSIGYAESMNGIYDWEVNTFPVIDGDEGGYWQKHKGPGAVLRVNDTLKMWYTGSSDGFSINLAIGYAYFDESLSKWMVSSDPVLENGELGDWDAQGVVQPVVYYDGSTYQMWYHGFENPSLYAPCGIGHATSTDGINWTKDPLPVMLPGPQDSFYDTWIIPNSLIYRQDEYQMWFSGWDGMQNTFNIRVGYATSPDGLDWTVENEDSCILDIGPVESWDSGSARMASVQEYNDTLRMWYAGIQSGIGLSGSKIGYAWQDIPVGINQKDITPSLQASISPNPCTEGSKLSFELQTSSFITIDLYTISGSKIRRLLNEVKTPGKHEMGIDMSDLSSGLYFLKMKSIDSMAALKLLKH